MSQKVGRDYQGSPKFNFSLFDGRFAIIFFLTSSPLKSVDNELKSENLRMKSTRVWVDKATRKAESFTRHIYRKWFLVLDSVFPNAKQTLMKMDCPDYKMTERTWNTHTPSEGMKKVMPAKHTRLTQNIVILQRPKEESKAQFYRMRWDGMLQIYIFVWIICRPTNGVYVFKASLQNCEKRLLASSCLSFRLHFWPSLLSHGTSPF